MSVFMVSEKDARRLKPSLTAGLVFVLGIALVLMGQVALNMVLTHDAYELRALKIEKRELSTEVQIIQEEVSSLSSQFLQQNSPRPNVDPFPPLMAAQ